MLKQKTPPGTICCGRCDGTGRVGYLYRKFNGEYTRDPCPTCKGLGYFTTTSTTLSQGEPSQGEPNV